MPKIVGNFDPTAATSGVIVTSAVGNATIVLTNMSNEDLLLEFPDTTQQFLRAWTENAYDLCQVGGVAATVRWSQYRTVPGDAPPESYVDVLLYQAGEAVPGNFPVVFPRWVNIGAEIQAAIAGTVDANVTNANLATKATIQNASLPVTAEGGSLPVDASGNPITLAAGTTVALAAGTEVTLPSGQVVNLPAGTNVGITGNVDTNVQNANLPVVGYRTADDSMSAGPSLISSLEYTIPANAYAVGFQVLTEGDSAAVGLQVSGLASNKNYIVLSSMQQPYVVIPISTVFDSTLYVSMNNASSTYDASLIVYSIYEPTESNLTYAYPDYPGPPTMLSWDAFAYAANTWNVGAGTGSVTPQIFDVALSINCRGTTDEAVVGTFSLYITDAGGTNHPIMGGFIVEGSGGNPVQINHAYTPPLQFNSWAVGTWALYLNITNRYGTGTYDIFVDVSLLSQ